MSIISDGILKFKVRQNKKFERYLISLLGVYYEKLNTSQKENFIDVYGEVEDVKPHRIKDILVVIERTLEDGMDATR